LKYRPTISCLSIVSRIRSYNLLYDVETSDPRWWALKLGEMAS
jgi:hypothetical protein